MKAAIASVAIVGAAAAVLLAVSDPACACVSPVQRFGWDLKLRHQPEFVASSDLAGPAVAQAATKLYRGTPMAALVPPEPLKQWCVPAGPALECSYVVASGKLREEQLRMRFVPDAAGKVQRVEVSEMREWRWRK